MKQHAGKWRVAMTALSMLLLGGCAVEPAYPPYYGASVQVAPPPPHYESAGAPPVVGYVWITGYWNWIGARYVWVPGRWEPPHPGYYWVPHRWEREGDHWLPHGGRWERDAHPAPEPRRHDRDRDNGRRPGDH